MPSRPLRIVHVAATPVGAPWMVDIARAQQRLGHEVAAILPSLGGTIAPQLAESVIACHVTPLDILSIPGIRGRARAILALVRLLRRLRPDVVHGHLLPSVVIARIASWIADVPIRFGANAGPLTLESELLRPMEIGTAFCDTRTIASCSYSRELFVRYGIPEAKTALVFYAADPARFDPARADGARVRRELGVDDDTPLVGMVAYFYPPSQSVAVYGPNLVGRGVKGHEVLLHAVPEVLRAFPNAKFALVGRGWGPEGPVYEQQLKDLARSRGVAEAVLFPGERSDVPDTLASFDISVHPSLNDNLGGTVESLLMARPMIVSDIRGYADTVIPEETGLVVPAGDAPALAAAIVRLLGDRQLARRLGENGRRRMLDRFTLAHTVADIESLMAAESGRAETHYRTVTMLRRALAMPFRLLPALLEIRRVMRRYRPAPVAAVPSPRPPRLERVPRPPRPHRPPFKVLAKYHIREAVKRTPARSSSGRVRIAQVAGVWSHSDWFVGLCRDLAARGYDVVAVIDARRGDLAARLAQAGIRHHQLALTFGTGFDQSRVAAYAINIPLAAMKLARLLRRERIDIVHSHIFATVVVARLAAALSGTRHVAGISGPRHLEAAMTRQVDRVTWWLDDATVAGCGHTREIYSALGLNRDRLECIYYGADADRFDPARADGAAARRALGVDGTAPLVGLVAQFYPPTRGAQTPRHTAGRGLKGQEDFLAAARIVSRTFPNARFVLAGDGALPAGETYRRRLIDECRRDDVLRDRVIFTGHWDDVPSLLAACDVAVQCSLTENLGGTIEALLMARPVVATRVGGMPESVRDGETGLLVPPSDPEAIAAAILRLLGNRDEAAAFGRAGRRLMLERFTMARMVDDVDALYARLVWSGGLHAAGGLKPAAPRET